MSDYFSKQWKRKPILLGLGLHFSALWSLAAWFCVKYWEWRSAAWRAPIAPFELGMFYLQQHGMLISGLLGLLIAVCLVGLTILSVAKRSCWLVLLNHLFVVLYWVYSLLLIGTMV